MIKWISNPKVKGFKIPVLACDICGEIIKPSMVNRTMARYDTMGIMKLACKCLDNKNCNYPTADGGDIELTDLLIYLCRSYSVDATSQTATDIIYGFEVQDIKKTFKHNKYKDSLEEMLK